MNDFSSVWLPGRFVTPEELDGLIAYLKDKRARLLRSAADPLAGKKKKSYYHIVILKDKYTFFHVCRSKQYSHAHVYIE